MQNSPSNDLLFPSRGGFCTIRPSRARMVELVDTRDLKSRGPGRVRAGSSPAPGTKINNLAPFSFRSLRLVCAIPEPIVTEV